MKQTLWDPFTHLIQDAIKSTALARHRSKPVKKTLFSQRLTFLRKQAGLTMAMLGQKTGVTASYISLLEAGDRQPSKDLVLRMAAVFFAEDTTATEELLRLAGLLTLTQEEQLTPQQFYEKALLEQPDDFHSFSALIRLLIRQQDSDEAEKHVLEGMKYFRNDWQLQVLMAQLQLSLNNYAVAVSIQQKAIEMQAQLKPEQREAEDIADLYTNLAAIYFLWGLAESEPRNFATAESAYQQALTLMPEDIFLQDEYAQFCFAVANISPGEQQAALWHRAIAQFGTVLNAPNVAVLGLAHVREISVYFAHAHSKAGRFEEAHHLLSILQACHPGEWLAHYARACFYSLRAEHFARSQPAQQWHSSTQQDLEQGLRTLAHLLTLPLPVNQIYEQIFNAQDLAFLRKQHPKEVENLCKSLSVISKQPQPHAQ